MFFFADTVRDYESFSIKSQLRPRKFSVFKVNQNHISENTLNFLMKFDEVYFIELKLTYLSLIFTCLFIFYQTLN